MSGNMIRQNPDIEEFARENATLVAMHAEENPNAANQLHRGMYKCKDCDKEYDSYQALGGHRASHRSSLKSKTLDGLSEDKQHECRACGEGFATGQALGGHMRKHWPGKIDQEKVINLCQENKRLFGIIRIWETGHTDEPCSSSSVTSNSIGKEVFEYDLNLTPEENEKKNAVRLP